ncbi:SDR family oxidoreductase [Duganella radicis]|uniref:SDR family oxidoreductase n=1 Tax=Duganella radicis TaxID=551988 RepID=A0A6L6PEH8_9BURK|nr:SDR family oxidoreductase [Duganella radicis]MTV37313.1 SDR family oxidoreductase [Duganella radicis]
MNISSVIPSSLSGKTVLIIGGTSGIGLSAAIQAKAAGAAVIVAGMNAERAAAAQAEHGFAGHRVLDVTSEADIERGLADLPRVDHLVLLAGSFVVGKVLDAELPVLHRAFDERLWAAVHVIRTLGDRLAADASITFISGALADRPNAHGTAMLGAASAAMEALARGLALELAPRRVNTLSPGPIKTPLWDKSLGDNRDAYVVSLQSALPLQRLGHADEAGAAALFLMTNNYMNGATLHVDGGSRLV